MFHILESIAALEIQKDPKKFQQEKIKRNNRDSVVADDEDDFTKQSLTQSQKNGKKSNGEKMMVTTNVENSLAFEESKNSDAYEEANPAKKALSQNTDDLDIQLMNIDQEEELFEDAKDEFYHHESGEQLVKSKRFFF